MNRTTARTAQPPKRADGRRNFAAIIEAAREAFAAHGASASLEAIARRAGVSIATLYRYFPLRATLIEAVVREDNAELIDAGERLAREREPLDALLVWTEKAITSCSRFRGLAQELMAGMRDGENPLSEACHTMEECGTRLLHAAQVTGDIRAEFSPAELFDVIGAAAWLIEEGGDGHQMLRRVQHGIRTNAWSSPDLR